METKNLNLGILAHVDAGKTTLAEGFLYTLGKIRSLGRVDHKDAFLDTYALEKDRGITIFSKQAVFSLGDYNFTLLDTPGHVDFSTEMERTLSVLDYAILVINGADGVQSHSYTLWKLLKKYEIPTFIFVNKMDQEGTNKESLLKELQNRLDSRCVLFEKEQAIDEAYKRSVDKETEPADKTAEEFYDRLAMCSENLMEEFLDSGSLRQESIALAIANREVYPCMFGSALKLWGIEDFLKLIETFVLPNQYPEEFGARVFKIGRDSQGNRLTYLKITGGILKAKMLINNYSSATSDGKKWEEKADQIRIYDGNKYSVVDSVEAGQVCAVTGLSKSFAGEGLGYENQNEEAFLEPVLTYQIILPEGLDAISVMGKLRQLEEEDPKLNLIWNEEKSEIHVKVMGEIQIEVLKSLILDRFGLEVLFDSGSIVYKETIASPVLGIGHFEPLRHYAEVHLLIEPGEPGSGLVFATAVSEDMLDKNWQRLIMTHLEERAHVGVLTGSEVTDLRIALVAGRAHQKHTEGGDFRQATYRAIRNGLKKAENILLEPVFSFTLEVPSTYIGRAMTDVKKMYGDFEPPVIDGDFSILKGEAPVATMRDYQKEVNSYTRGMGRLSCLVKGYAPCHNAEEIVSSINYDSEADISNPTGSVFCAHGAGFVVPWDRVDDYAHIDCEKLKQDLINKGIDLDGYSQQTTDIDDGIITFKSDAPESRSRVSNYISLEEIDAIFEKAIGSKHKNEANYKRYHKTHRSSSQGVSSRGGGTDTLYKGSEAKKEEYLLVDGYNIIFSWDELRDLAAKNIDSARDKLIDIMCNYQGYIGHTLILVYDAYKVKGNPGSIQKINNIYVVYTKEAETADQYIEKTVHDIGKKYRVTVATSDGLEQMIIWGEGASRMSSLGLKAEVAKISEDFREKYGVTLV